MDFQLLSWYVAKGNREARQREKEREMRLKLKLRGSSTEDTQNILFAAIVFVNFHIWIFFDRPAI